MPTDRAVTERAVLDTYRYLRGGMAVMIVFLGAAVVIERLRASCWQTSISAYYFTSAHGVFIAALCAIGTMLIVYRGGSDTEDVLLNLAGILAFVVAMVPTTRPVLACGTTDVVVDGRFAIVNTWAVVIALALSRVASWWMNRRTGTSRSRSTLGAAAAWTQRALLAAGLIVLASAPEWFRRNAHEVAAVAMFAAIILTVVITAFVAGQDAGPRSARPHRVYQGISVVMALTLVAAVGAHQLLDGFNHAVIVVEAALIAEFAAYWMVQTVELWGTTSRVDPTARSEGGRMRRAL